MDPPCAMIATAWANQHCQVTPALWNQTKDHNTPRTFVCFHGQHKVQRRRDHTGIENHGTGTTLGGGLAYDRSGVFLAAPTKPPA
jgi:hypothetical protein